MDNIGALWVNISKKSGNKFMAGQVTVNGVTIKIVVFKNTKKKLEAQPDFNIVLKSSNYNNQQQQQQQANNYDDFSDF